MVHHLSEEEYRKVVALLKTKKAAGRDDVLVEQLKNIGPKFHRWRLSMLNKYFMENKTPTIWRQSQFIVIRKPAIPKSYRTYPSCVRHANERMILYRIALTIDLHIIKEDASFRPGKSFTSQVLNIT